MSHDNLNANCALRSDSTLSNSMSDELNRGDSSHSGVLGDQNEPNDTILQLTPTERVEASCSILENQRDLPSGRSAPGSLPGRHKGARAFEQFTVEREKVLSFMQHSSGRRLGLSEIKAGSGLSDHGARRALAGLEHDGEVLRLGFRGKVYLDAAHTCTRPALTIDAFERLVASVTTDDPAPARGAGPASDVERRARTTLSPSQAQGVSTAINHLKNFLKVRETDSLTPALTAYSPDSGEWRVVKQLDEFLAQPGKDKSPTGPQARAKIRSSLTYLLDLAANHNLITRDDGISVAWLEWLPPGSDGERRHRTNCRRLAEEAIQAGFHDPADTNWRPLAQHLRRPTIDRIDAQHLRDAITAFRKLHPEIELPPSASYTIRLCPVKSSLLREAHNGDWSGWTPDAVGRWLSALAQDQASLLPGWVDWMQATSEFMPNGSPRPTRREVELVGERIVVSNSSAGALRSPTVLRYLRQAMILLDAAHEKGHDIGTAQLLQPDMWGPIVAAMGSRGQQCLPSLGSLVRYLVALASFRGDHELVRQGLETLARLRHMVSSRREEEVTKVRTVIEAFGGSGEVAYTRLLMLRDLEINRIERLAGKPIHDQLTLLSQQDKSWCTPTWAKAVRDLALFNLLLRVPLRAGTALHLRLTRRLVAGKAEPCALWVSSDPNDPSAGAIRLSCDKEVMKSKRRFHPNVIIPASVGIPEVEASLRRGLFALYLCPDGARHQLCKRGKDQGWFLVKENGHRLEDPAAVISKLLLRHGPKLGIAVNDLAAVNGLGLHAIRHAYGSRFAPTHLLATSRMLHHKSVAITEAYYCKFDESDVSHDVLLGITQRPG